MNDLGPRPMDGFARPSRPAAPRQPQSQPQRPAERPQRPVQSQPMAARRPQVASSPQVAPQPQRPVPAQRRPQVAPATPPEASVPRRGGGWRVVLQFVVGLLVIAGVAAAIVMLYLRYYQ
jgi:hypothetical protein